MTRRRVMRRTVERRSSAMREEIDEVPTLRPTLEEFLKPLQFFEGLKELGETYGIVRVVTPKEWRPKTCPETIEPFDSYRQAIHEFRSGCDQGTGDNYSREEYRTYARTMEKRLFQKYPMIKAKTSSEADTQAALNRMEKAYWDVVERKVEDEIEVDYASNHPVVKTTESDVWDLSGLIREQGNLMNKVGQEIKGVTTPWLYHGCLFSTFCWHVEDHWLYSINYLHEGAPKIWYGIPASSATAFEDRLTPSVPTRARKADMLNRLNMMFSPYSLPESFAVYKAVQNQGDMILTFPRAYHAGFNAGWNCAEAVNFAMMNWVMFGQRFIERLPVMTGKEALFSHDRLLWILMDQAQKDHDSDGTTVPALLERAFAQACTRELEQRTNVRASLFNVQEAGPSKPWDLDLPSWECYECSVPLFFSLVSCRCRVDASRRKNEAPKVLCLRHALVQGAFGCGCSPHLCKDRTDEEIRNVLTALKSAVNNAESNENERNGAV